MPHHSKTAHGVGSGRQSESTKGIPCQMRILRRRDSLKLRQRSAAPVKSNSTPSRNLGRLVLAVVTVDRRHQKRSPCTRKLGTDPKLNADSDQPTAMNSSPGKAGRFCRRPPRMGSRIAFPKHTPKNKGLLTKRRG